MGSELKKMSELLKSGATMLSETCPECGSPLFRVGREIICAKCNRQVVIVKSTEEEGKIMGDRVLQELEQTLLSKIKEIDGAIRSEKDPDRLGQYGKALLTWLDAFERVRRLKPD